MIVELVGLPGVGKSFLCRSLASLPFRERLHIVVEAEPGAFRALHVVPGKLGRAVRFTVLHARTVGALLRTMRSGGRILRYDRLTKLVNLLSESDRAERAAPSRVSITEQGVLQAVWSLEMLSDDSVHAELLRTMSRWLPAAIVFVETDRIGYETWLRRREGGRSHFDRLGADELPAAIERGQRRMREILDEWGRLVSDAERLDFWNEDGVGTDAIVEWVDRRCATRCAAAESPTAARVDDGAAK